MNETTIELLQAENTVLRAGYDAARLEIASLQAQLQNTENLRCKSTQKRLAWLWGFEPVRKPLTNDQILALDTEDVYEDRGSDTMNFLCLIKFARAVEAAHGIK